MECSIRTCEYTTESPLGMTQHSKKHRNRFERLVGHPPDSYQEVRDLLNEGIVPDDVDLEVGRPATLDEWGDS